MESLASFDIALFRLINSQWTAPWLDSYMTFVTEKFNFLGAVIAAAALILILGKRHDRIGLVLLVVLVLLSDLAADTLKHILLRVRPCNALDEVRLLVGCSSSFSLPSGHATNIFASMVFLSVRYRRFTPFFLFLAVSVAYSRVYVGVHYPGDVFVGALLGSSMAIIAYSAERGYLRERLIILIEMARLRKRT